MAAALYLVRHASAGDRFRWWGDDVDRPLDDRGRVQAQALADGLAGVGITRVLSSRAVRCQQTVGPLAARLGLEVEVDPALFEGGHVDATTLVRSLAGSGGPDGVVLCSHGDVIPEVVRDLFMDGMRITGGRNCAKGSVWALSAAVDGITHGHYHPTPGSLAG